MHGGDGGDLKMFTCICDDTSACVDAPNPGNVQLLLVLTTFYNCEMSDKKIMP